MGKGKNAGIAIALITLVTAILGGGSITSWSFDFSQTTIGQIGDNIINNYLADQGIDWEAFKELCRTNQVHDEIKQYCALVP